MKKSVTVTSLWRVAISMVLGLSTAMLLRYGVLENETQGALCSSSEGGVLCPIRAGLGWSIHYQLFGLGGLVVAALAWLPKARLLALTGVFLSAAGLLLYNTTYAAAGLIVALLAALR